MTQAQPATDRHVSTRVQHEVIRRTVAVVAVVDLSPSMRRVVFGGDDLRTFKSLAFDDHVKAFFPAVGPAGEPATVGRDFTPRHFDADRGELTIDFALHHAGPATAWARGARPGDPLQVGGPKGSLVVADDFDWYLMVGDETALPAIGRRLEELRPGAAVTTVVAVADGRDRQSVQTAAAWTPVWVTRDPATASDEPAIRRALDGVRLPDGDGSVWLAGESAMVRSLRTYLIDGRGVPADRVRAAGYWRRGEPGAHERV